MPGVLLGWWLVAGPSSAVAGTVIVDVNRPGVDPGDGLTWSSAFRTVGAALGVATEGDEIWVAGGIYAENVQLKKGVALFGGFAGTEISRDQRNWQQNVCVLDGAQAGSVITVQPGSGLETRIDGFAIAHGRAGSGAGIVCVSASPTIANNRIESCAATSPGYGGGIFCSNAAPAIVQNLFLGNAAVFGGALVCQESQAVVQDNAFERNTADRGGAILLWGDTGRVEGNRFFENSAQNGGGGLELYDASTQVVRNRMIGNYLLAIDSPGGAGIWCDRGEPLVAHNLLLANAQALLPAVSEGGGGGIFCTAASQAILLSNTLLWNEAQAGGPLYCQGTAVTVVNNLLAFNSSGVRGTEGLVFRHNCLFGNREYAVSGFSDPTGTEGNIALDPRLTGDARFPGYHLLAESPCRDSGDPAAVPPEALDLDGEPRIQGSSVDIGADEFDGTYVEPEPSVLYVLESGDDTADGQSWSTAKRSAQAAIDIAGAEGAEIWVGDGVYVGSIRLRHFVYLWGGFTGAEESREQRKTRGRHRARAGACPNRRQSDRLERRIRPRRRQPDARERRRGVGQ